MNNMIYRQACLVLFALLVGACSECMAAPPQCADDGAAQWRKLKEKDNAVKDSYCLRDKDHDAVFVRELVADASVITNKDVTLVDVPKPVLTDTCAPFADTSSSFEQNDVLTIDRNLLMRVQRNGQLRQSIKLNQGNVNGKLMYYFGTNGRYDYFVMLADANMGRPDLDPVKFPPGCFPLSKYYHVEIFPTQIPSYSGPDAQRWSDCQAERPDFIPTSTTSNFHPLPFADCVPHGGRIESGSGNGGEPKP